jgi:hypothetical protein
MVEVVNNVFDAGGAGSGWFECSGAGAESLQISLRYNLFNGEHWEYPEGGCSPYGDVGPGNLFNTSAMYCDAAGSCDYTLHVGSPAIGAGENGATMGAFGPGCGFVDVPEDGSDLRPEFRVGPARPNPARGPVRVPVFVRVSESRELYLEIYDASGREVAATPPEVVSGGAYLKWDSRNAAGDLVPTGVYYAAVRGSGLPTAEPIKIQILQ